MRPITLALLPAILFTASPAFAGEEFGVEESFASATDVPAWVARDIGGTSEAACFTESMTTVRDALEATVIDLGNQKRTLLLKPKLPGESKSAWGCFCGAYACPMWIYSVDSGAARRIWSSAGASVKIVDHKDDGSKRLLASGGSAGHQEAALYGWNGKTYRVLREKSFSLDQGEREDQQAEQEMAKFLVDAAQ